MQSLQIDKKKKTSEKYFVLTLLNSHDLFNDPHSYYNPILQMNPILT